MYFPMMVQKIFVQKECKKISGLVSRESSSLMAVQLEANMRIWKSQKTVRQQLKTKVLESNSRKICLKHICVQNRPKSDYDNNIITLDSDIVFQIRISY